jgi:NADH-quinone oxidoreductase subunit L
MTMPTPQTALALIVLLPLFTAIMNGLFGKFFSKGMVNLLAVGSVVLSFACTVYLFFELREMKSAGVADPIISAHLFEWISVGSLKVGALFHFDSLSAVMTLIITGVGSLIHIYSTGYMSDDPGYSRYFTYLNLFMFSMLVLVLGGNLAILFFGWEGVGLCSYLLIGFWFDDAAKAAAGQKAFVTNRIGDFGFLLAILLILFCTNGSLDFNDLEETFTLGSSFALLLPLITFLLFTGAMGKSAQIPLYVWLPDAMAGPTPVSALIHAATMVTAGVYMVARLNFLYIQTPLVMGIIAVVGGFTALYAASIALTQRDIKKVLAYSTVSQLGFMFVALGSGAFGTGIFHVTTHAFFKACLFLGAGAVIHALHGEQDGFKMGGLKKYLPVTRWTFLISTIAIAGLPPFAGFFSKDEILWNAFSLQPTAEHLATIGATSYPFLQQLGFAMALVAAAFTAFYMMRLYLLIFHGEYRGNEDHLHHLHKPSRGMKLALIVLGVLAATGGLMGIPAEGMNRFGDWLTPVFSQANTAFAHSHPHSTEYMLMGLSVVIAALGMGVAYSWYKNGVGAMPGRLAERFSSLYNLLSNAYFMDAVVEQVVKRPFRLLAKICHQVIDRLLIDDLLVHGPAAILSAFGEMGRRIQTGDVQQYAVWITIGLTGLLYIAFM